MESSRGSVSPVPIHLHPATTLSERVLLPGDPARALRLAQALLSKPVMFNHHRGLWGYTGVAPDGRPATIQSTGMGGPSAAIVVSELADLGAQRLIRVGTCGALTDKLALGDLVAATTALPFDGTSRALCPDGALAPDPALLTALRGSLQAPVHAGPVASTDLFYDSPAGETERWRACGALAVEMETAALFAVAGRRELRAAALLLVTNLLAGERVRISDEALTEGELRLGEVALGALLD